jgi:hypothetical protein
MILAGVGLLAFRAPAAGHSQDRGQAIREIDDGATGDRWLLVRDATDPGGPGRMVLVASANEGSGGGAGSQTAQSSAMKAANAAAARPAIHRVIHAGDALVVEEHSAVVDARLEATALASAVIGMEFAARLKIGGKVVRVTALAPGRAALVPEPKAHP